MRESNIQDDIAAAEKSIAECDDIINENLQYHVFLDVAANYKTKVENAKNNLSTLPVLKKQVFDQIDSVTGSNIEYEGFTYDETQGLVTITNVKLTKQLDAPSFVKAIKNLNYFVDVQFSGYTGTGEGDDPVIITSLQLYMKGQGEE